MKTSTRFKPLHKFQLMKEQDAALAMAQAQQRVRQEEEKLAQLNHYQSDYQDELRSQGKAGVSARQLQSYHQFLQRLSQAIGQQEQHIQRLQSQLDQAQQQWYQEHGASQSLDKLIEKHQGRERTQAERREQQEQDEQTLTALRYE